MEVFPFFPSFPPFFLLYFLLSFKKILFKAIWSLVINSLWIFDLPREIPGSYTCSWKNCSNNTLTTFPRKEHPSQSPLKMWPRRNVTQTVKGPPPHPKNRAEVREERMREPLEVAEPASPRAHAIPLFSSCKGWWHMPPRRDHLCYYYSLLSWMRATVVQSPSCVQFFVTL